MAAVIKFDQTGLPAGVNSRSRSDIVAGTAVTITNVNPGTVNACELLGKPTDDNTAVISGASPTWSVTPKSGTFGTYRIRLTVDGDISIHTFTVRSPNRGLPIGCANEAANPDANLADTDPGTWTDESETNEDDVFFGWWPGYEELAKAIERSLPLIEDLTTVGSVVGADELPIRISALSVTRKVSVTNLLSSVIGQASKLSTQNKAMAALVTSSDGDAACATAIAATPFRSGSVEVFVNGLKAVLGDGVKTTAAYFSGDGGTTARALNAIQSGDRLYWNGSIAKFQLATTDVVSFVFAESA